MFDRLKSLKTYSYEYRTLGRFPGGQKDEMLSQVWMDRAGQKLCYKNREQLVMMNPEWIFKADHGQHTASIFRISSYNKRNKDVLPDVRNIFQYDMASVFMDSVLLQYGQLLSSSVKGDLSTYRVGFSSGGPLKEVMIVYNTARQLPESIYFRTETKTDNQGGEIVMEIWCRNYSLTVPASVFDEKQYFSLRNGKAVLNQFKNYKIYSVL